MSAAILAEVGKSYLVPCIYVARPYRKSGWPPFVPVIGPRHNDAEHLKFPFEHFHIDWRFAPEAMFVEASWRDGVPHATVVTSTTSYNVCDGAVAYRRRICRRAMPDFPTVPSGAGTRGGNARRLWASMEQHQADSCSRLKPGNICPHRGIDLTPFIQADGTVICPGHGMKWDTKTGELLSRHRGVAP